VLSSIAQAESPAARRELIRILADIDQWCDVGEVGLLLRGLIEDRDSAVRLDAIQAVVARREAGIDDVRRWLQSEDPDVRRQGMAAVGVLGRDAAPVLPELQALLEESANPERLPIEALASMKEAARPLIPAVIRYGTALRVAPTLAEIGASPDELAEILTPLLSDNDHNRCWHAGMLLAKLNPDEARRQVARLVDELTARESSIVSTDPSLNALTGLGTQAKDAVPLLIRLLSHPQPYVPAMATATLGKIGPDAAPAVPALIALLEREPSSSVIDALGKIGPEARGALPRLLEIIDSSGPSVPRTDGDPRVVLWVRHYALRASALRALGGIGDSSPQIIGILRRCIHTNEGPADRNITLSRAASLVRIAALQSLVLLANDAQRTLPDLLPLFDEDELSLRVQAVLAIGHLTGDRGEAIGPLTVALTDENIYIQLAAALALGEIGPAAGSASSALEALADDCRNTSPNQWRRSMGPTIMLEFVPGGQYLRSISLADAARHALAAIRASSADSERPPEEAPRARPDP
jgi:HEAT repeat protein